MIKYIVTITWPIPLTHVERLEVDADDALDALTHAMRAVDTPPGCEWAIRPDGYVDYDFRPSVPGCFDELAALSK